jgi:hypothetical protein
MQVMKQRNWTKDELIAAGFRYYDRRKQLVMAGRLPRAVAPLRIQYNLYEVYAEAGDIICYDPGTVFYPRLRDYEFWSVKPNLFIETYKKWDAPDWQPNQIERFFLKHNCRPYYKFKGVWAKQITNPTYVLSLESREPALLAPKMWLAIGEAGEPWGLEPESFARRYVLPVSASNNAAR